MPSDYQKWVARDVKPEEPRERTQKEKRANWWYYHWRHVALCLLAVVIVCFSIAENIRSKNNQPDCQIAYVGATMLPSDTVMALEAQLAPLIGDLDHNGKCIVQIRQYTAASGSDGYAAPDPSQQMAMTAQLAANENFLFLLDDPAAFQAHFGLLTLPDGSYPEDDTGYTTPLWYSWSECPVLAELPLGDYEVDFGGEKPFTGDSQTLMSDLYIGRSIVMGWSKEQAAACSEIWATILTGQD